MSRVFNFSAGPATLPLETLEEAAAQMVDYQGSGMSIMEMSHRGKHYDAVHQETLQNFRDLMELPGDYEVLLMQGGATTQFSLVPMNLLGEGQTADYINAGDWGKKAISEAKILGKVHVAADCGKEIPTRQPLPEELDLTPGAAYLHCTSNETISGTQMKVFPESQAPLVCDMSSDILSYRLDVKKFGLIYAGAQKNLGPSGVALVVIRKDLAERVSDLVPEMFRYKTHIANQSLYNTPPTFGVYMLCLVTRWLKKQGGVEAMQVINERKAGKLYAAIDATAFYRGTAVKAFRSNMNVTFRLPTEDLENRFVKEATAAGLDGLKGHRSVGGIRASIYNAMPEAGVDALIAFMKEFEARNG